MQPTSLQDAFEASIDICIEVASDGKLLSANPAACALFGPAIKTSYGESLRIIGFDLQRLKGDVNPECSVLHDASMLHRFVRQHQTHDMGIVEIEWSVSAGKASGSLIGIGRDVTAKRSTESKAHAAHQKVELVLNSITEGCVSINSQWQLTYINDEATRWLQNQKDDLIGKCLWNEFPEAVEGVFFQTLQTAMLEKVAAQCDAYYAPLGRWLNARAYPSEEGLTVFFLDISSRKRKEEQLLYAGSHDALTGLLNREACLQNIADILAVKEDERLGSVAVLLFDLDKFKEVNDALGHRLGDHVLRLLGMRLRALNNESRYCGRLSGDAFLFVFYPSTSSQAQIFARRLLDEIIQPFEVAGQRVIIGASVGVAIAAEDEKIGVSDLINQADTAMYAVKASGRLGIRLFDAAAGQAYRRRLQLRNEMAAAIDTGQFRLHYQPQVRLSDGTVVGAEALIRWQHPSYGLLSPAAFLDIAEESPVILQLGAWVCDEACRQLAHWWKMGQSLQVAINVSARQLVDPDFPRVLRHSVEKHGITPQGIELEITESMMLQDLTLTASVLTQLGQEGFRIALDDFGTGYSNLAYVNRLPINVLKIDRSFISDIGSVPKAMDLVQGIISLAKSLKLDVVCEGVETLDQRRLLEQTQCDALQGYLISKPLPSSDFTNQFLSSRLSRAG
jgi:diguanylate cyclase (GGDEF)-like protein